MVLRIKNFNILGVHWKIRLLGGRCSRNTNAERELPKKGGLDSLLNSRGGLGKKEGGVFLRGVDTPMHTIPGILNTVNK